jgi:protein-disulfide isomerase
VGTPLAAQNTQQPAESAGKGSKDCCTIELGGLPGSALPSSRSDAALHLVEGNPASSTRIVIYEDLQCPDCAAFRKMMDKVLLQRYGQRAAFEHRDFPLPKHVWARRAAVAARYFQDVRPQLAIAFRRHVLENLRSITDANFAERLAQFAQTNGADSGKARAALEDSRYAKLVEADFQEGLARGVRKTPTVFVDGRPFVEQFTVRELSEAIGRALTANR